MYNLKITQKIAFTAVFAAICILFKFVKFPLYTVEISFSYIPNFLAGIFLGPLYGMAVGFTGDIIGTLLKGFSPSPLILLGNTLIGGIMGFVYRYAYIKNIYFKIIGGAFCVFVIVTLGINTLALTLPPISRYASYLIALPTRIPQIIVVTVNTGLVLGLYPVFKNIIFKKYEIKKK